MPILGLTLKAAEDALKELAGLGHDEPEAVNNDQHLQQILALQRLHRLGEIATLAERSNQIRPCLRPPCRYRVVVIHLVIRSFPFPPLTAVQLTWASVGRAEKMSNWEREAHCSPAARTQEGRDPPVRHMRAASDQIGGSRRCHLVVCS